MSGHEEEPYKSELSKYTCSACGGHLQVVEVVQRRFTYDIHSDLVDWESEDYSEDSWMQVECIKCRRTLPEYELDGDSVVPAGGAE